MIAFPNHWRKCRRSALLNKAPSRAALASGDCQKPGVLGFQPASKTEQMVAETGPVAWFHRRVSLDQMGAFFTPTLRYLRLVAALEALDIRDPPTDLLDFGSSLRHSPFIEKTMRLWKSRKLGFCPSPCPFFKFLHIALTCAVDAPCAVCP